MAVDWQQLEQIRELTPWFSSESTSFRQEIDNELVALQVIDPLDLDNLALLRVLEVTNGCAQWGFRRQDQDSLSADQARDCMRQVIGFIKDKRIVLPSGETFGFSPAVEKLIESGRELYQDAFKRNQAGAQRAYYAASTAQFIAYGPERLQRALTLVELNFESLFTPFWIARGQRYIAPYLQALI
jgi:hypothetical protein